MLDTRERIFDRAG